MTQQELEKCLWGVTRHHRCGGYKQHIFPLLFFKRISDVYDEEFANALAESDGDMEYGAFAENHHFQIPAGAHWNDVREKTVNIGAALQEVYWLRLDRTISLCKSRHRSPTSPTNTA